MDNDTTLLVENISKKFSRGLRSSFVYGAKDVVRELVGFAPHQSLRKQEFWALQKINFRLKRGEALGLIGANGCGKTTLIKIMSGLIKPTSGRVHIKGRVAPLIALGAGFNPVLTGRENIFINLAILGLSSAEIKRKFEDVANFAEIWEALDAPLRTYSSGMSARLGFACAIHTDPDILFVDEVLAVGDARFRVKCYSKLAELRSRGTSLILVSHSANAILSTCETGLYLSSGRPIFYGSSSEALQKYQLDQDSLPASSHLPDAKVQSDPSLPFQIRKVGFTQENGNLGNSVVPGRPTSLNIEFEGEQAVEKLSALILIREHAQVVSDTLNLSSARDQVFFRHPGGKGVLKIKMPECGLKPGRYSLKIALSSGDQFNVLALFENFFFESLQSQSLGPSSFFQSRTWELESQLNEARL